jgi:hypothetical protein
MTGTRRIAKQKGVPWLRRGALKHDNTTSHTNLTQPNMTRTVIPTLAVIPAQAGTSINHR